MGDVEVHALRGVSLSVEQGEFTAIMGASGSGKSTLMNIVGCLDRPTSGRYLLDGQEVSRLSRRRARRGAQPHHRLRLPELQPALAAPTPSRTWSCRSSTPASAPPSGTARAAEALARVGLGDRADHHPNQMSGGQQQRVAIARALVTRPRVILADEPTGNLDSRTSVEVMALFQELGRAGITVVLVTHEPDIAQYASRVVVMRDGKCSPTRASAPSAAAAPAGHAGAARRRHR